MKKLLMGTLVSVLSLGSLASGTLYVSAKPPKKSPKAAYVGWKNDDGTTELYRIPENSDDEVTLEEILPANFDEQNNQSQNTDNGSIAS